MEENQDRYGYLRGLSLGMELAIPVILFAFLGLWIDKKLSVSPVGLIIGVMLGAVVGFWNIYKFVLNGKQ
jgi:F0F1-type ATP synthase assembly protein I